MSGIVKGYDAITGQWIPVLIGKRGPVGPSAYDSAVTSGYVGTEAEWATALIDGIPIATAAAAEATAAANLVQALTHAVRSAVNSTDDTISYIGTAPAGSLDAALVWDVSRTVLNPNGTVTTTTALDIAWTGREEAVYS